MASKNKQINTALVLGGGGARGVAHLGVLDVLTRNNIPVDLVVGTSIGAIIGALFADGHDMPSLKDELLQFTQKDLIEISIISALKSVYDVKHGVLRGEKLEKILKRYMKSKNFSDLQTKFIAIATNLDNGKTIALDRGELIPAIRASYSIPWLFPAVKLYGMNLVDGGVSSPLAVDIAKEYNPKLTIAVELVVGAEQEEINSPLSLIMKSMNITYNTLSHLNASEADIIIRPKLPKDGLFSDKHKDEIFHAGVIATEHVLPQIQAKLVNKKTSLIRKVKDRLVK